MAEAAHPPLIRRPVVAAATVAAIAGVVITLLSPSARTLVAVAAVVAVVLVAIAVTRRQVVWAGAAVALLGAAAGAGAGAGLGVYKSAADAILLFAVFHVAATEVEDLGVSAEASPARRRRGTASFLVAATVAALAVGAIGFGGVAHGAWLVVPAALAVLATVGLVVALALRASRPG